MYIVRKIQASDIAPATELYFEVAPPSQSLQRIGSELLVKEFVLKPYISGQYGSGYVFEYDNDFAGYVTYAWDRNSINRDINAFAILMELLYRSIKNPAVIADIADAFFYNQIRNKSDVNAEMVFCGVKSCYKTPEFYKKTKLKFASMLYDKALEDLLKRNIEQVETYTSEKKELVFFLLASKGFIPSGKKYFFGRKRIYWLKNLK